MWENYTIAERMKQNVYRQSFAQVDFRRTRQQKEIDYIEEENGQLRAFEFKWNERKANIKCPEAFVTAYPDADFQVVTPKNVEGFLMENLGGM